MTSCALGTNWEIVFNDIDHSYFTYMYTHIGYFYIHVDTSFVLSFVPVFNISQRVQKPNCGAPQSLEFPNENLLSFFF